MKAKDRVPIRASVRRGAWAGSKLATRLLVLASLLVALGAVCKRHDIPGTPRAPNGPTEGEVDLPDTFTALSSDLAAARVRFEFDWGDGDTSWTDYFQYTGQASHSWANHGTYDVRVRTVNEAGDSSGWSVGHPDTIFGYPNRVVATIPVGRWPWDIAALPDGKHVYLTTTAYTDTIYEISTLDNSIEARIGLDSYPIFYA